MKISRILAPLVVVFGAIGLVRVMTGPADTAAGAGRLAVAPDPQAGESVAAAGLELGEFEPAQLRRPIEDVGDAQDESMSIEAAAQVTELPRETPTLEEMEEFRAYVKATLVDVRREQAAEMLAAIEQRGEHMDLTISRHEERLALTPGQSARLRSELLGQLELEAEYVWQWEQGADEEILGELKQKDHEAHLLELARFLTGEQLETYRSP